MPIQVTDLISTTSPTDTYATHDSNLGKGGLHSVSLLSERDLIPSERRMAGMLVYVKEDSLLYQLSDELDQWYLFEAGSGGIQSVDINDSGELLVTYTSGQIDNVGRVKGDDGPAGVSVINANLVEDPQIPGAVFVAFELSNGVIIQTQNSIEGYNGASISDAFVSNDRLFFELDDGTLLDGIPIDGIVPNSIVGANIVDGDIIFDMTDGSTINAGLVGDLQGRGIENVDIVNGQLIITFDDDTPDLNAGDIPGVVNAFISDNELQFTLTTGTVISAGDVEGLRGVGVDSAFIEDNELKFNLTDSRVISAGLVQGLEGASVTQIEIVNGDLIFTLSNGQEINVGEAIDLKGDTGRGIQSVELLSNGNLLFTYDDATTEEVAQVKQVDSFSISNDSLIANYNDGAQQTIGSVIGPSGVSISSASISAGGDLILELSDDTEVNAGFVRSTTNSLIGQTYEFNATEGQTSFEVFQEGNVIVYVNGQILSQDDIDLSIEDEVILTSPVTEGDLVTIIVFSPGAQSATGRGVVSVATDDDINYDIVLEDNTTFTINVENPIDPSDLPPGIDNVEVTPQRDLIITLTDNTIINAGNLGEAINVVSAFINGDGQLIIGLSDSTELDAGNVLSDLFITNAEVNLEGELILTLNSGDTINAGSVIGGVNTTNAEINEEGNLIITLSDGTIIDAGKARNPLLGQVYDFIAFPAQVDFPVEHNGNVMVYANGVNLSEDSYDLSDPQVVTLITPREGNDIIRVVVMAAGSVGFAEGIIGQEDAPDGSVYGRDLEGNIGFFSPGIAKVASQYDYSATQGQDVINLNHNGLVEVIIDGTYLMEDQYSLPTSQSIILSSPLNEGQRIRVNVLTTPNPTGDFAVTNYSKIEMQTFSNTGTFSSGAWRNRQLNTIVTNGIGANLFNNRIILPSGNYYIRAKAAACGVSSHIIRLYNETELRQELLGEMNHNAATSLNNYSEIDGYFSLDVACSLLLQHRCSRSRSTYGFGRWETTASVKDAFTQGQYAFNPVSIELWRVG